VNLRPVSPPVPLLFALLVLVAVASRFGAQALAELSGSGQAQLWGLGAMWTALAGCGSWLLLMLVIAYVQLARPLPLPPRALTPEPVTLASEVVTGFRPNMVFVPWGNGLTKTLHISGEQLDELQSRIGAEQLGLPVNGMQTFTSAGMKHFRREAVAQELAVWEGRNKNIAHLTEEGAAALLRSSPALAVSARVRANVRDTNAYD
jgi:hypothetical protein